MFVCFPKCFICSSFWFLKFLFIKYLTFKKKKFIAIFKVENVQKQNFESNDTKPFLVQNSQISQRVL